MKTLVFLAPLLALALAGCKPSPSPTPGDEVGGSDGRAGTSADTNTSNIVRPTPSDPIVARWAERVPDSLLHRRGACPFECCVYGTWTPTEDVPLREAPRRALPFVHTVPAGEAFAADSGFVRITGISVLAVADTANGDPQVFVPGDTLVVLDYVGEGRWNVWDGERVHEVSGFWGAETDQPRAELIGGAEYAREWWVHVTTRDSVRGWLDADSVARIDGVDACGG